MEGRSGPTSHDRDLGLAGQTRRADAQDDLRPVDSPARRPTPRCRSARCRCPRFSNASTRAPFVGRAGALRRLRQRWQSDLPANGGLVVVTGEPGIGKTRLAARFAAGVHAGGGVVLCGRADEESVWPYQAFVEALRHYAAHRRDVVADARHSARGDARTGDAGARACAAGCGRAPSSLGRRRRETATSSSRPSSGCCCTPRAQQGCCSSSRTSTGPTPPTTLLLRHVLRRSEGSRLLVVATLD